MGDTSKIDIRRWNVSMHLGVSGTESAILNQESGDSESCDSNRAVHVGSQLHMVKRGKLYFGLAFLSRFSVVLLKFVATRLTRMLLPQKFWRFRVCLSEIVRFVIRDSVPLSVPLRSWHAIHRFGVPPLSLRRYDMLPCLATRLACMGYVCQCVRSRKWRVIGQQGGGDPKRL